MNRSTHVVLTLVVVLVLSATPAGATSFFDIFTDLPSVGPPSPPHDQGIGHMSGAVVVLDLIHHTTVRQISAGGAGGNPLSYEIFLKNGLPNGDGVWGVDSFFDITYRIDLEGGAEWPALSFFDIFYEIEIPGAGPAHLVPIHREFPSSDPARFFAITFNHDSFFDITFRVEVGPGGGCHELSMHAETQPGARFRSLTIVHQPSAESFFDVFFELETNPGPIQIDPSLPIMKTTTTGEFTTPPVSTEAVTWGKVKSLYSR